MLATTVELPARRAPSPQIRARDTSLDGAANASARINRTPNVDAGINAATHLGGHCCGDHEGDGDDSTNDQKLAEHKTTTCQAPFRDVMTTLAHSFADDYLERVVLISAPDLDHVDLVDDGKSAIWVKVLRC
jgi:hypothetical protein